VFTIDNGRMEMTHVLMKAEDILKVFITIVFFIAMIFSIYYSCYRDRLVGKFPNSSMIGPAYRPLYTSSRFHKVFGLANRFDRVIRKKYWAPED